MMVQYVAFEIDRGNLRVGHRPTALRLCGEWTDTLSQARPGFRIAPAFRHTGNYVITDNTDGATVTELDNFLIDQLRRRFAVFSAVDFMTWFNELGAVLAFGPD